VASIKHIKAKKSTVYFKKNRHQIHLKAALSTTQQTPVE